ncbi:hypothetical protein ES703_24317 [subsurface metagenome]
MKTGIVYDPIYLEHRIGVHVESHERLVGIMNFLKDKKVLENPNFELIQPRKATTEQIKYVHQESLINEVKEVSEIAQVSMEALNNLEKGEKSKAIEIFEKIIKKLEFKNKTLTGA